MEDESKTIAFPATAEKAEEPVEDKPIFSAEDISLIMQYNQNLEEGRQLTAEDFVEIAGEKIPDKLMYKARYALNFAQKQKRRQEDQIMKYAMEKVTRGELVMAMKEVARQSDLNRVMVFMMAMAKILFAKEVISRKEIDEQVAAFAKGESMDETEKEILEAVKKADEPPTPPSESASTTETP